MQREMAEIYVAGVFRACGAMVLMQLHMLTLLSLVGRTTRKEKDSQGSCQEENYLYAAVRKCYNDWWEAQGEWPDTFC